MDRKKEQFSHIYDQYIEKIYRFIYLKVSSQEIAEDLTSKVFLRGWEAYQAKGETIENPSAFLYQIARNAVVDHYREKGKTHTVSVDHVSEVVDQRLGVHEKAAIGSDMEMIKKALLNIKKEYQDIIIWHYLEDMSAEEIAVLTSRPAGTVRVMIHRGLESLKNELSREV